MTAENESVSMNCNLEPRGKTTPTRSAGESRRLCVTKTDDGTLALEAHRGAMGSSRREYVQATTHQLMLVSQNLSRAFGDDETAMNTALTFAEGLDPKDETEGLLVTQMTTAHLLAMEFAKRAIIPQQDFEVAEYLTNRTVKLMRVFNEQLATLQKYRGKGQQKVTVKHVHVNEGGQAIVGSVEGGGSAGK